MTCTLRTGNARNQSRTLARTRTYVQVCSPQTLECARIQGASMHRYRPLTSVLVSLLAAALVLAGCGSGSDGGGTTAIVWHGEVDISGDALAATADRWNSDHPD